MTNDAYSRQLARELDCMNRGLDRYFDRNWKALQDPHGETAGAKRALPLLLPEVSENIRKLVQEAKECKGRRPKWYSVMSELDPDTLAASAIRSGLQAAMRSHALTAILDNLGYSVLTEVAINTIAARGAKGREVLRSIGSSDKPYHQRLASVLREAKVPKWTLADRALYGSILLNALLLTENWEYENRGSGKHILNVLVLTEKAKTLINEIDAEESWARPVYSPMVVPPKPWTAFNGGGYLTDMLRNNHSLVRYPTKEAKAHYRKAIREGSMDKVLEAVNAIQAVKLAMDPFIIDLTEWAYEEGLSVKKLPRRDPVPVPEYPENFDTLEPKVKYRLYNQIKKARAINTALIGRQAGFKVDIADARSLVGEDVYLPHNLDFRGRIYPMCYLSHYRADYVKAWFRFGDAVPLGSQGLRWLMIHLANMGDFDKVSKEPFDVRVKWVEDNLALISRVANDPRGCPDDWVGADKPFSFVQACREYVDALGYPGGPEAYPSSIVTDVDGSNSGIQHYSAALRARDEGALVSLVPLDKPNDLYKAVSKAVEAIVDQEAQEYPWDVARARSSVVEAVTVARENKEDTDHQCHRFLRSLLATLWKDHGVGRAVVKRNVMTYAYSAGPFGFRDQLLTDLMEPLAIKVIEGGLSEHPFGEDDGKAAATYLAKLVYEAVVKTLASAARGMEYMRKVAALLAHEKKGVWWETLDGFRVHQCYREPTTKEVNLTLYNRTIPVWERAPVNDRVFDGDKVLRRYTASVIMGTKKEVVKHTQRSAIAPNGIHSSDACHLRMAVLDAREKGITDVLLIHDSFGCHAANLGDFADSIRFTMASMYTQWSLFESIRDEALMVLSEKGAAKVPDLPPMGDLDLLEDLPNAIYSFS